MCDQVTCLVNKYIQCAWYMMPLGKVEAGESRAHYQPELRDTLSERRKEPNLVGNETIILPNMLKRWWKIIKKMVTLWHRTLRPKGFKLGLNFCRVPSPRPQRCGIVCSIFYLAKDSCKEILARSWVSVICILGKTRPRLLLRTHDRG